MSGTDLLNILIIVGPTVIVGFAITLVFRFRAKVDRAYASFLFCGASVLLISLLSAVPMHAGMAGGLGFFVAIPVGLASLCALIMALRYTIAEWPHAHLILLSVLSLLFVAEILLELGPGTIYNGVTLAYGVVATAVPMWWFLVGRRHAY